MDASKGTVSPIDVLMIDDDESFLQMCVRHLEEAGFRAAAAKNAAAGLQMTGSDHPGVVLLDLKVPGMNGLELLKAVLKAEPS